MKKTLRAENYLGIPATACRHGMKFWDISNSYGLP